MKNAGLAVVLLLCFSGFVWSQGTNTPEMPKTSIPETKEPNKETAASPVTPTVITPTAITPTAITPTAITPTAITPTAITPTAIAANESETVKNGITDEEISALIGKLSADDPQTVNEARKELTEIGKPAVTMLIMVLEKSKPEMRYMICEILGGIRDNEAVPALLKLLQDKTEYTASIASAAARSLVNFTDDRIIPNLIPAVTSTDIDLRYETIKTLGTLRAHQALPLIKQFITDTNKTSLGYLVKAAAVEAVGKLRDRNSVKQLIGMLRNTDIELASDEPFVRYAIKALERITNHQEGALSRIDEKKKEQVIKKWEDWWDKNKKDYE